MRAIAAATLLTLISSAALASNQGTPHPTSL